MGAADAGGRGRPAGGRGRRRPSGSGTGFSLGRWGVLEPDRGSHNQANEPNAMEPHLKIARMVDVVRSSPYHNLKHYINPFHTCLFLSERPWKHVCRMRARLFLAGR